MYKHWAGIFLMAACLCLGETAQAGSLLTEIEREEGAVLYEKPDSEGIWPSDEAGQKDSKLQPSEQEENREPEEENGGEEETEEEDSEENQEENAREEESLRRAAQERQPEKTVKEQSLSELQAALEGSIRAYPGNWQIYVKDLKKEGELSIGSGSATSASLIKTFVMAAVYDQIAEGTLEETDELNQLLKMMITVSDNEAYNELVRRLGSGDFAAGCQAVNQYLQEQGYGETGAHHTLHPAPTASQGDGLSNVTSAAECGRLLEQIYYGNCVSEEASVKMLKLLCGQQTDWKIPAGIPEQIQVANKTGETDACQHDIAIVYGPSTTYILCVMSYDLPGEDAGISGIQAISAQVYDYFLNQ